MKLTEINIYPVKSMGSISLKEATVLPAGLQYDRRWLLNDEEGNFLTQRHIPEMAKVKFTRAENGFKVNYVDANYGSILIPFESPASSAITATVWDDKVSAYRMNKSISEWFSDLFKRKCYLVRIAENAIRRSTKGKPDKVSSFADITPFLIIGTASLDDLNSRMETPIPMSRFRPNFVFSGGEAYAEDYWDIFQIGNLHFKKYKKCGRCKVTTIDQKSGIKMGEEPLATLSKYRKEDRNLNFGIRAFLDGQQNETIIRLNDSVAIHNHLGGGVFE